MPSHCTTAPVLPANKNRRARRGQRQPGKEIQIPTHSWEPWWSGKKEGVAPENSVLSVHLRRGSHRAQNVEFQSLSASVPAALSWSSRGLCSRVRSRKHPSVWSLEDSVSLFLSVSMSCWKCGFRVYPCGLENSWGHSLKGMRDPCCGGFNSWPLFSLIPICIYKFSLHNQSAKQDYCYFIKTSGKIIIHSEIIKYIFT